MILIEKLKEACFVRVKIFYSINFKICQKCKGINLKLIKKYFGPG